MQHSALAAIGITISAISAVGGIYKTYKAARKEFREAQKKLAKSKATARSGLEAALADATALKQKWDKMVLRQNDMSVKIDLLDTQVQGLDRLNDSSDAFRKMKKDLQTLRDDYKSDRDKLVKISDKDPKAYVT